jgi:hypothetical protein
MNTALIFCFFCIKAKENRKKKSPIFIQQLIVKTQLLVIGKVI